MKKTTKRVLSIYMLFTVCFMAILARIVYINFSSYSEASESQSTRSVEIGTTRGKIYDRNMKLLVDEDKKLVAAVTPVVSAGKYLQNVYFSDNLSFKIEKGYPFTLELEEEINNEIIRTFSVPVRYGKNTTACHIVGYTDSSGKGVTGIEKAYDGFLSENSGMLSVSFEVDALGRVLAGMDKTVVNENFDSKAGVVLTIDKRIQQLTEEALEKSSIESGCAIVMDALSGDILSLVSVPEFDRENVANSFEKENSPLMNKALSQYSAGSVFKSIVAAFALEEGIGENFTHHCKGTVEIKGKTFSCYSGQAHGDVDLSSALQKSCNAYFIKLMQELDTEKFLDFCRSLGFGESIELCNSIVSESGILPDAFSLKIEGNEANFAFGQGDLLVTPLQIAKAYVALATGRAVEPQLVFGICTSDGNVSVEKAMEQKEVISGKTVKKMRQMLFSVTEKGIATNAKSSFLSLAGKTGTAESGVFDEEGNELLRTWFAGFFPADDPRYVVVVMNETGSGGNTDCAPVFRNICEWIVSDKGR